MTSSTQRFQNKGFTGDEANAYCSTSSITKLAMTAETGEPKAYQKSVDNKCRHKQNMSRSGKKTRSP